MHWMPALAAAAAASLMIAMSAPAVAEEPEDAALAAAITGDWRSVEARARDRYRNPAETVRFWGLEPGMTVLEVQPGANPWWTEILAPYARMTGGKLYATGADLEDESLSQAARRGRAEFEARYAARPELYGEVRVLNWGPRSAPLPENRFDLIITARSAHGWVLGGWLDKALADFFHALKPGGILGLKQHRADPESYDPNEFTGYLPEDLIIEAAERAGFRLVGRSEINANPHDTKDHPFGVWTLPPTRASAPLGSGQAPDPDFDRAHYDAIGESDRMTLKFEKPRG
jgi:predicted methyltransferase